MMNNIMNKLLMIFVTLLTANISYASDPWACVNALGHSDSNNPTTTGCNDAQTTPIAINESTNKSNIVPSTNVTPPATQTANWIYIGNHSDITQCKITPTGINLASCNKVKPSTTTAHEFSSPNGMYINHNILYITGLNYVTQCNLTPSGIDANSCFQTELEGYQIANPQIVGNTFFYTTREQIAYCTMNKDGIETDKCKSFALGDDNHQNIKSMTIADNMVYVLRGDYGKPNNIVQCSLDKSADMLDTSTCKTTTPNNAGQIRDGHDIKIYNNIMYVAGDHAVTTCSLNPDKSINITSCRNYAIAGGRSFRASSTGNNKLYVVNDSYNNSSISSCNLTTTGIDAQSCRKYTPAGDGELRLSQTLTVY